MKTIKDPHKGDSLLVDYNEVHYLFTNIIPDKFISFHFSLSILFISNLLIGHNIAAIIINESCSTTNTGNNTNMYMNVASTSQSRLTNHAINESPNSRFNLYYLVSGE